MSDGCRAINLTLEWASVAIVLALVAALMIRGRFHWHKGIAAREGAIVLIGLLIYFGVRHLTEGEEAEAIAHGRALFDLEHSLGIAREGDVQSSLAGSLCAARLMNWMYIWWHWPVILVTAAWLLIWHRSTYYRYRNAILISGAIGLVVFATYPMAPPRLVPDIGLIDTVTMHSSSYRVFQPHAFTNQFAAMPSLHFGWNLLMGIALVTTARGPVRTLGVLMPLGMLIAIIATANHFILDAVAGAALALLGLAIASRWRLRPPWRGARAP